MLPVQSKDVDLDNRLYPYCMQRHECTQAVSRLGCPTTVERMGLQREPPPLRLKHRILPVRLHTPLRARSPKPPTGVRPNRYGPPCPSVGKYPRGLSEGEQGTPEASRSPAIDLMCQLPRELQYLKTSVSLCRKIRPAGLYVVQSKLSPIPPLSVLLRCTYIYIQKGLLWRVHNGRN